MFASINLTLIACPNWTWSRDLFVGLPCQSKQAMWSDQNKVQEPKRRTMTMSHSWAYVVLKSEGNPTVRDSFTGVNAVSRTGSKTTKNRANNDIRTIRTAAKIPRDIIIHRVSPLSWEARVKLEVHDENHEVTYRKWDFQIDLPNRTSFALRVFVFCPPCWSASPLVFGTPLQACLNSGAVISYLFHKNDRPFLSASAILNTARIAREMVVVQASAPVNTESLVDHLVISPKSGQ